VVQRDFQRRGWAILEVTAGQEWRRDSQILLCRHFCDTLPNHFSLITEEGVLSRGGVREDESDESFIQLGEGLFGETPRCRGYGAECFKAEEKLCAEGVDNWTCEPKERVRSKVTLRNMEAGLNVRGVPFIQTPRRLNVVVRSLPLSREVGRNGETTASRGPAIRSPQSYGHRTLVLLFRVKIFWNMSWDWFN